MWFRADPGSHAEQVAVLADGAVKLTIDGGPVLVIDRTNDGTAARPAPGERIRLAWPATAMQPLRDVPG